MTLPLIQDCVLVIVDDTVGFEFVGNGVLMNCLTDADTLIEVSAGVTAYVLDDQGTTYSGAGTVEPLASDRAAWDALLYPELHTDDVDDSTTSIHHTLGTGPHQASPGDHAHSHAALTSVTANQHHNQAHVLGAGGDHSDAPSNIAHGFVKRNAANAAWEEVAYGTSANTVAEGNHAHSFGGHTIKDEGVALTTRINLDFVGSGVEATDDAGNTATRIYVPRWTPLIFDDDIVIYDHNIVMIEE